MKISGHLTCFLVGGFCLQKGIWPTWYLIIACVCSVIVLHVRSSIRSLQHSQASESPPRHFLNGLLFLSPPYLIRLRSYLNDCHDIQYSLECSRSRWHVCFNQHRVCWSLSVAHFACDLNVVFKSEMLLAACFGLQQISGVLVGSITCAVI